jgi:hypothetical protein
MFSLICGIQAQHKYYTYIAIYTEHIPKGGIDKETRGGGKEANKDSE